MKSNFIVIGPRWRKSATRMAVFGDVVNGRIPDAHFLCAGDTPNPLKKYMLAAVGKLKISYRDSFAARMVALLNVSLRDVEKKLSKDKPNVIVYSPITRIYWAYQNDLPQVMRKKYPDCKHVFFLIDGMQSTAEINHTSVEAICEYLKQFDCVFTYDRIDSQRFGYEFAELPILHADADPGTAPKYDLYFCGRSKGRSELLCAIQNRATEKGLQCSYRIVSPDESEKKLPGMKFSEWTDYVDIVRELNECSCLLDINAESNNGTTLRCKEAILYNKKLLTMNPQVKQMKYYDPRWMRVFTCADDIDYEWLAKREPVDYRYQGDYSPAAFFEQVERKLYGAE